MMHGRDEHGSQTAPAAWVLAQADLLPGSGDALDVACGRGRHALWLASRGLHVLAVDRDREMLRDLSERAARGALSVRAEYRDLETRAVDLGSDAFDAIVAVNYLHRPLFPALIRALRPGGVLVYETFTRAQAQRGRPRNPDFLLEPGELRELVAPLEIVRAREGDYDGRFSAAVVARKPRPDGGR